MAKYFNIITDKSPLDYKCGEKISIKIVPKMNNKEIECKYISWEIIGDDGKYSKGYGTAFPKMPLCLETTLDKPGFVRITCNAMDDTGITDTSFDTMIAGVGAEVEKLHYCDTLPKDFDDYWADIEKMVADFDCQTIYKKEIDARMGFRAYDVRISTPDGMPASGVITVPDKEGEFPIRVGFIGYGLKGAINECEYGENTISAVFNAHGFENNLSPMELKLKYYEAFKAEEDGCEYGFSDKRNSDKMKTYWRNMMIRNLIAVKFLKSLPQWNNEGLTAFGGSQGALQATTVAAHDKDVTFLEIRVPWFCNLNSNNFGFIKGWRPEFAEGLRYFDTVAQSMRVKCPVKITASLGDTCCPPSTTMTLYNTFNTAKSIEMIQSAQHSYLPPEKVSYHLVSGPENIGNTIEKGIWRHYKGKEYTVLDIGYDSETLEEMVIYRANYGDGSIWVRPKWMFGEYVNIGGKSVKRFEFVSGRD